MLSSGILALVAVSRLAFAVATLSPAIMNPQIGPYPVSISHIELKTNRDDPLAPQPGTKRRLMLSVYRPQLESFACTTPDYQPYMPNKTGEAAFNQDLGGASLSMLPGGYIDGLQVEYCAQQANATARNTPLLLFQPGYQGNRYENQVLLGAVASSGYTIISMDITYEAPIVEFSDGSYVLNNTGFSEDGLGPDQTIPVRAADYSSVIDALRDGSLTVPGSAKAKYGDVTVGIFGHSIGGAAAVLAASQDKRIVAAINWDGQFFPFQANLTVNQPTLLVQREEILPYQAQSWETEWGLLKGPKAWIIVDGSQHLGFTDLPNLVEAEGLRKGHEQLIAALGGTIAPNRMREIVWRYTVNFFDAVLRERKATLLVGPSPDFPDVKFNKTSVGW